MSPKSLLKTQVAALPSPDGLAHLSLALAYVCMCPVSATTFLAPQGTQLCLTPFCVPNLVALLVQSRDSIMKWAGISPII